METGRGVRPRPPRARRFRLKSIPPILQRVCPQRFPRLREDYPDAPWTGSREEALAERAIWEEKANELVVTLAEHRRQMGYAFLRVKGTCEYGGWREYYDETYASRVPYRSAARYMRMWRRAHARARSASLAILKPGTSPGAEEIGRVTREVEAKVHAEIGDDTPKEPDYRFPLPLGPVRKAGVIQVLKSPDRRPAQKAVVASLDVFLIKNGFATKQALEAEGDDREVSEA